MELHNLNIVTAQTEFYFITIIRKRYTLCLNNLLGVIKKRIKSNLKKVLFYDKMFVMRQHLHRGLYSVQLLYTTGENKEGRTSSPPQLASKTVRNTCFVILQHCP